MKKNLLIIILLIPVLVIAQKDTIQSGIYSWQEPTKQSSKNIFSVSLFEGSVHDMEYLQMSANIISFSKKKLTERVPADEEQLMIIKSGMLAITIKDSDWTIGPGSIALLIPGEKYLLRSGTESCHYYLMKYRSKLPADAARGKSSGGSFVKDWSKIEFKPHDKGGIRNFFERPTAMCKRFEMHVTTLKKGIKSHDPHTHKAEEIILVINGKTEMQIGDKFYKGHEGSIYYLGSDVLHGIRNDGNENCTYFAFQFE